MGVGAIYRAGAFESLSPVVSTETAKVGKDSLLLVCLHQQVLKAWNSLSWTLFVLSLWTQGGEHLTWESKPSAVLSVRCDQQHTTTESLPHDPQLQTWETHWTLKKETNNQAKTKIQTCTKYLHINVYKTLHQVLAFFVYAQTDQWNRNSKKSRKLSAKVTKVGKSQCKSFLLLNHQETAWITLKSRLLTVSTVFYNFNEGVIVHRV